jgi:hypothetical protein
MKRLIFDPVRDLVFFVGRGIRHAVVFGVVVVIMWSMVKLGFPAASAYLPLYPRKRKDKA